MIAKLLPVIFLLVGLGGGIGAGIVMSPPPEPEPEMAKDGENGEEMMEKKAAKKPMEEVKETEFHKINNQFVVPVIKDGRVASQVVLSLSLETEIGFGERIFALEPKLRGSFLQVLFDHANMGGFKGMFTDNSTLDLLRKSLTETAQNVLGDGLVAVVITDIARQDT